MLTASAPGAVQQIDWSGFLHRRVSFAYPGDSSEAITGKTILITGAGGSIGSALAFLLMAGPRHKLILLDRSNDNLSLLNQRYKERKVTLPEVELIHGDISDRGLLQELFARHRPHIVFHAAALKHLVPLEADVFTPPRSSTLCHWRQMFSRPWRTIRLRPPICCRWRCVLTRDTL